MENISHTIFDKYFPIILLENNQFVAQLWKVDDTGKLVNRMLRNWKYRDKNCTIPVEGQEGYIEIHGIDQVMQPKNGMATNGTEIDFQVL